MTWRANNVASCLCFRPCVGVPLGIWIAVSIVCYWKLISRINVLEIQNEVFKSKLQLSQNGIRQISAASDTTYHAHMIPDATTTLCETIHIALVCMYNCTRIITPMLKSLLQHRQNPIHFHFIVDSVAEKIITKLFETWDLPAVKHTCYNAESQNHLLEVLWIPNTHYSGVYPLLKLLFPDILPKTLNRVIVLDSDLTFLCDVAELWYMFRNMRDDQLIGLVENESNWYFIDPQDWPALGRGFNVGVMLLNLEKIRSKVDWTSLWRNVLYKNLKSLNQTRLADQDVINAIIKEYPKFVYNMNCEYNVQLATKMQTFRDNSCYREHMGNIKIIHWNSKYKYGIEIKDMNYFKNILQSYINFDGNLLKEKSHRCSQSDSAKFHLNRSDICLNFHTAQRVKLRTHLYYMEYTYADRDSFAVTLVLQLSMNRLQFLERLVKYWGGPISAAIYLSDCEVPDFESFIFDWSRILKKRQDIGYHLVFKHDSIHYPVNYLLNVALENVNTPYVLLMDVDCVPMVGLYDNLRYAIKLIKPHPQKKCLAVTEFQTEQYRTSLPRSKAALKARLLGDVAPFREREWLRGYQATNYSRWLNATMPYEVEWQSNYEPYLVVHRSVPKYDTRFSGFGWNKASHSVELRAQGYRVVVLPDAFVVHTPHASSHDITAFHADRQNRICLGQIKREFMEDLKRKYNITLGEPRIN